MSKNIIGMDFANIIIKERIIRLRHVYESISKDSRQVFPQKTVPMLSL